MISLKRNSKKELITATGLRTRVSSVYTPNQKDEFKVKLISLKDLRKANRTPIAIAIIKSS